MLNNECNLYSNLKLLCVNRRTPGTKENIESNINQLGSSGIVEEYLL